MYGESNSLTWNIFHMNYDIKLSWQLDNVNISSILMKCIIKSISSFSKKVGFEFVHMKHQHIFNHLDS